MKFTGRLSPEAVQELAAVCNLKHLEELDLMLGNPIDLGTQLGEFLGNIFQMVFQTMALPAIGLTRWSDFGPALESLSAAGWVRRLRRLTIRTAIPEGYARLFAERLYGNAERAADGIPDAAVLALADAMNRDKLETLVLPAAVISPSVREELTIRLGERIAFS